MTTMAAKVDPSLKGVHRHQHINNNNLNHHHQPKSKSASPPKSNVELPSDSMQVDSDPASQNNAGNAMNDQQAMGGPLPASGVTVPVRPPPRPFKRADLSLEQNPFEVSFASSSSGPVPQHPAHPTSPRPDGANGNPRPESNEEASTNKAAHSRNPSDAGAQQKISPKPTLPPLSAIAEPTQESANSFPWGFSAALSDAGSLRAGPLSPAMLPGPRQQDGAPGAAGSAHPHSTHGYFDAPSLTFRTGLTPGLGRTGLTPLVGGPASFPPPSPGTAAFLAMVTNGAGGASAQAVTQLTGGATITPNTLSALTGSLIQHPNGAGEPNSSSQAPPAASQSLSVARPAFGQQTQNYPNNQHPSQAYRGQVDSYPAAQNAAAAAAADGLFLLSQAHQELTKREEQAQAQAQADAAAAAAAANMNRAGQRKSSTLSSVVTSVSQNGHNKRKSGDTSAPPPTTRPSNAKRARGSTGGTTTTVATASSLSPIQATRSSGRRRKSDVNYGMTEVASPDDDDGDSLDEDDLSGIMSGGGGTGKPKKFETEEEKRKNFLERNRQAALKCRQRKKAWLTQLQQQVEYLKTENERLQGTIVSMRDEVTRLSAVVVAHRSCGLGGVVVPGYTNTEPHGHSHAPSHSNDGRGSPVSANSPIVSVAPVSVPVNVPPPQAVGQSNGGYGY